MPSGKSTVESSGSKVMPCPDLAYALNEVTFGTV